MQGAGRAGVVWKTPAPACFSQENAEGAGILLLQAEPNTDDSTKTPGFLMTKYPESVKSAFYIQTF
jgi:hypothetical protein